MYLTFFPGEISPETEETLFKTNGLRRRFK